MSSKVRFVLWGDRRRDVHIGSHQDVELQAVRLFAARMSFVAAEIGRVVAPTIASLARGYAELGRLLTSPPR